MYLDAVKRWKCSEAIGWNTLARSNIAFLEALKWGADVIYSWDNDNLPTDGMHFLYLARLWVPFTGIKVTGTDGWFDPGQLLIPKTRHRGFPHDRPPSKIAFPVVGAKVGVAAGLVIGDPDCDAVTRIETTARYREVFTFSVRPESLSTCTPLDSFQLARTPPSSGN